MEPKSIPVLICGARSGRFPLEAAAAHPEWDITVHAWDCHQARKIREDLAGADIEVVCSADFPERAGGWPLIRLHASDKLVSGEFELDAVQDAYLKLAEGGRLETDVAKDVVEKVFPRLRRGAAVKAGPLKRTRDFSAVWSASVPGGPSMAFTSRPGCFCHRRADEGGLALAEVAVRTESAPTAILDMGCGSGFCGILVADAVRRGGGDPSVLFVDSHTRALACARANAERAGLTRARFLLSDDGIVPEDEGSCDCSLCNPPYYGDGAIARLFVETAYRALKAGGVCLCVAKNPSALVSVLENVFGSVEMSKRRGYTVLKAVK